MDYGLFNSQPFLLSFCSCKDRLRRASVGHDDARRAQVDPEPVISAFALSPIAISIHLVYQGRKVYLGRPPQI